VRIFKNKWFHHWCGKEKIADALLVNAARDILEGRVEADLGGGLFKKRLARLGRGKSGVYRVIVGYKNPNSERIIFLYAFAKSKKANLSTNEEAILSTVAESFIKASDAQVDELLKKGSILEVERERDT
jgi:hypothetical protein